MAGLISVIVSGIAFGFLYALMGMGLVAMYRGSRVINFAYGAGIGLVAYISDSLASATGSEVVAILGGFVIAGVVGYIFRLLVIAAHDRTGSQMIRARGLFSDDALLKMVVSTLGLALIIEGVEPNVWGSQTRTTPFHLAGGGFAIGGVTISWADVEIVAAGAAVMVAFALLLGRTKIGFNIRALLANAYAANLLGLKVGRSFTVIWVVGAMIGLAAAFLASEVVFITPTSYTDLAFTAFIAIVIGGLDSLGGAVVGGLIVGIVSAVVDRYLSGNADQPVMLVIALAVLIFRPQGLLSSGRAAFDRL